MQNWYRVLGVVTKLGAATKPRERACNVGVRFAIKRLFVFLPVSFLPSFITYTL